VAQVEYEYKRGGTLAHMGADDVHQARLFVTVADKTGIVPFMDIQRKVIKPADFADLAALGDRLERFTDRYNQTARPFDWRFTTTDLAAMLDRVDTDHDELAPAA
jgi:hypothetical protein